MCCKRNHCQRRRGPIATLVIAGVALTTKKVQEKRQARADEKATRSMEDNINYEEVRQSVIEDAQIMRRRKEIEAQGERQRGISEEREAPPAYHGVPTYDHAPAYDDNAPTYHHTTGDTAFGAQKRGW